MALFSVTLLLGRQSFINIRFLHIHYVLLQLSDIAIIVME
jgi:hypothetical protein